MMLQPCCVLSKPNALGGCYSNNDPFDLELIIEIVAIKFRYPDSPFEFTEQEHVANWFSKGCTIQLFSLRVTAKSRLAATSEGAIKAFRYFL